MSRIKSKDTSIEKLLRKELWTLGYRYRKNYKDLPGNPDIVYIKEKIAVFCDGDFWHGKDWEKRKKKLDKNKSYWISKIEKNIIRDKKVNKELKDMGWTVLRFWGSEIKRNPKKCAEIVEKEIINKRNIKSFKKNID